MAIVPFTLNEYAYCWNNPLVLVDLDGLSPNIPEGLTVFIDPGHGGSDPGATITEKTNFWTGKITRPALNEKDVNLEVSLMVRDILEDNGITVYMSRTTDQYVTLKERVRLALEVNPDLFISIHHNSSNTFAHGTKVYYPKVVRHGDSAVISSQLAETVNSFVSKNTGLKNKKIHEGDYYVLNQFLDPTEFDYTSHQLAKYRQKNIFAILTETGYIGGDARFLGNSENLQIIAESIASGILTFFSEQCCEL